MRVIVFDLDDTLAPERDFVRSGLRAVRQLLATELGEPHADVAFRSMTDALEHGRNHYSALERLADEWMARGEISRLPDMKRVVDCCRNTPPDMGYRLDRRMEGVLMRLAGGGDMVGVITDGRSLTQRNKIEALALRRWMADDDIMISEETGHDKRSPHAFSHFMERYPRAEEYVYVGDNPAKDFETPNSLGWTTVMIKSASPRDNVHAQSLIYRHDAMPSTVLGRKEGCIGPKSDIMSYMLGKMKIY